MTYTFSGQMRTCSIERSTAFNNRIPALVDLEWRQKGLPLGVQKASTSRDRSPHSDCEFPSALPGFSSFSPHAGGPGIRILPSKEGQDGLSLGKSVILKAGLLPLNTDV